MSREPLTRCVVYVANADTQDLSVFELRADGEMQPLATVPVHRPVQLGRSIVLTVSADRRFLYAGHLSGPGEAAVVAFAIDAASGHLAPLGVTRLVETTAYLSIDRSGRFLLSASYAGNSVSVHPIGVDGCIGAVSQIIDTQPKAHCIITDPSNRFALHTSLGADLIYQAHFDASSGRLTPNVPPATRARAKSGPRFLTFAPNASRVYAINELDGTVDVYPFDPAAGTLGVPLQTIQTLPERFAGQPWGGDIHFRPDAGFLYVSERTTSMITAFEVDQASGRLARIDAYPTVRQPRAFAIDPSGTHLVAVGQLSHTAALYLIDAASGELIGRGEYAVRKNPTWVEIIALR